MKLKQLFRFYIILIFPFLMIQFLYTQSNSEGKKISLLILTGGHEFEREAFFNLFDAYSDISYQEVIHPEANDIYLNGMAEKADVLVFYDMMQEISDDQMAAMEALLERGKPCLFLHHALASYQDRPEYEKIIGGKYILSEDSTKAGSTYRHDVEIAIQIKDANHPITETLQNFTIHDEVYGAFKVCENSVPLLTTDHSESGPVIAWTNTYGNSHIVYIQPGHDHHGYENPQYRRLVHQALLWLAGKI
jgi:type 1 glutamine amidotransferase